MGEWAYRTLMLWISGLKPVLILSGPLIGMGAFGNWERGEKWQLILLLSAIPLTLGALWLLASASVTYWRIATLRRHIRH